jgi:hypothetical protein
MNRWFGGSIFGISFCSAVEVEPTVGAELSFELALVTEGALEDNDAARSGNVY